MKPQLLLLAVLPLAVVCVPIFDFISPSVFSRANHQQNAVFNGYAQQVAKDGDTGCNWGTFQLCLANFISDSGLGAYNTMNATYLKMAINQFLADGATSGGATGAANNLVQLCRAQQKFYGNCLGWNQVASCVSAIEFIRQGNTSNDGFGYQMTFTRLNFQCGVSFTSFIGHALELAQTPTAQAAGLQTCLDTFIGQLNSDNVTEFCGPMEQFNECEGKIYATAASSVDFGWAVCEASRIGNIITLPMCTDSNWACKLGHLQKQDDSAVSSEHFSPQ